MLETKGCHQVTGREFAAKDHGSGTLARKVTIVMIVHAMDR